MGAKKDVAKHRTYLNSRSTTFHSNHNPNTTNGPVNEIDANKSVGDLLLFLIACEQQKIAKQTQIMAAAPVIFNGMSTKRMKAKAPRHNGKGPER
jgi:hypothetical protein